MTAARLPSGCRTTMVPWRPVPDRCSVPTPRWTGRSRTSPSRPVAQTAGRRAFGATCCGRPGGPSGQGVSKEGATACSKSTVTARSRQSERVIAKRAHAAHAPECSDAECGCKALPVSNSTFRDLYRTSLVEGNGDGCQTARDGPSNVPVTGTLSGYVMVMRHGPVAWISKNCGPGPMRCCAA
jgi:hypothetical protein